MLMLLRFLPRSIGRSIDRFWIGRLLVFVPPSRSIDRLLYSSPRAKSSHPTKKNKQHSEGAYGKLLAPYLDDPSNLFIVSSDFCHWGSRFNYTFVDESKVSEYGGNLGVIYFLSRARAELGSHRNPPLVSQPKPKPQGEIWQSVQWLDELGMRIIEGRDPAKFSAYLQEYRNTICGRHPIGVLLNAMANARTDMRCGFRFYDQSSHAREPEDSSVSYASALVCVA